MLGVRRAAVLVFSLSVSNIAIAVADELENQRNVHSFLYTNLMIGGFFETALVGLAQHDQSFQAAASSNILGVNLSGEFSDSLRFVSQVLTGLELPIQNEHNDPRGVSVGLPLRREFRDYRLATLITQGYLQWNKRDSFVIEGGLGYAPFGYTFQLLELVLFVRRRGPQLLRTTQFIHPLWQGVHVHGTSIYDQGRLTYNVYSFSPATDAKMLGIGTRLGWSTRDDRIRMGISSQTARRGGSTYVIVGPDFRYQGRRFRLTSELAKGFGSLPQAWSFYVRPEIHLFHQSVLLYVFGDYAENPNNRTGSVTTGIPDPYKKWEYGTGINWLPTSFTRLRLGVVYNDYVGMTETRNGTERDHWLFDLSGGVAF